MSIIELASTNQIKLICDNTMYRVEIKREGYDKVEIFNEQYDAEKYFCSIAFPQVFKEIKNTAPADTEAEKIKIMTEETISEASKDKTLIFNGDFKEVISEISKVVSSEPGENKPFFPFVPDLKIESHGIYTAIWVKGKFISEGTEKILLEITPDQKKLSITARTSAFDKSPYDLENIEKSVNIITPNIDIERMNEQRKKSAPADTEAILNNKNIITPSIDIERMNHSAKNTAPADTEAVKPLSINGKEFKDYAEKKINSLKSLPLHRVNTLSNN